MLKDRPDLRRSIDVVSFFSFPDVSYPIESSFCPISIDCRCAAFRPGAKARGTTRSRDPAQTGCTKWSNGRESNRQSNPVHSK